MTALYVTHDQAEAVVLGDRIGVMRDGKLLQMGTPDEIYNRPADLFVANFTGATNEITGTLLERNGAFGVVDIGGGQRVEASLVHGIGPGEKVRIALRPENIALGAANGSNAFRARVLDRRYQGTQTVYDIDLPATAWKRSNSAPRRATTSAPTRRYRCRVTRSGPIATRVPRWISRAWPVPFAPVPHGG